MSNTRSLSVWTVIGASRAGTSHREFDKPSEDAHRFHVSSKENGNETLVVVASDGAGSASHGGEGAVRACEIIEGELSHISKDAEMMRAFDEAQAQALISKIQCVLKEIVTSEGKELRDYACTILAALVSPEISIFFQIGDGAIVVRSQEGYAPIFWPQSGEYYNATWFVTSDDATDHLCFATTTDTYPDVAVFTDGIQGLALDYAEKQAYQAFFEPMFDALRRTPEEGLSTLNDQLGSFLDSERVNARTDDDKTLILASCCEISSRETAEEE